ncbi:hypothetical protein BGW80DRAFT_1444453 [Lactifluus volemus]|nr:hypothetical protein BGW80DRAFT_1444453 [Lactifluus volemus]
MSHCQTASQIKLHTSPRVTVFGRGPGSPHLATTGRPGPATFPSTCSAGEREIVSQKRAEADFELLERYRILMQGGASNTTGITQVRSLLAREYVGPLGQKTIPLYDEVDAVKRVGIGTPLSIRGRVKGICPAYYSIIRLPRLSISARMKIRAGPPRNGVHPDAAWIREASEFTNLFPPPSSPDRERAIRNQNSVGPPTGCPIICDQLLVLLHRHHRGIARLVGAYEEPRLALLLILLPRDRGCLLGLVAMLVSIYTTRKGEMDRSTIATLTATVAITGTRGHGDDSATSTHGSYDDATAAVTIRQDSWGEPVYGSKDDGSMPAGTRTATESMQSSWPRENDAVFLHSQRLLLLSLPLYTSAPLWFFRIQNWIRIESSKNGARDKPQYAASESPA